MLQEHNSHRYSPSLWPNCTQPTAVLLRPPQLLYMYVILCPVSYETINILDARGRYGCLPLASIVTTTQITSLWHVDAPIAFFCCRLFEKSSYQTKCRINAFWDTGKKIYWGPDSRLHDDRPCTLHTARDIWILSHWDISEHRYLLTILSPKFAKQNLNRQAWIGECYCFLSSFYLIDRLSWHAVQGGPKSKPLPNYQKLR